MTETEKRMLLSCGLFQNIPEAQALQLLKCLHAREAHYEKNDIVWNIGDPVAACAVILTGSVRAETVNSAGEHTLMAYHESGALVGDILMATPGSRSPVYVIACECVTLMYLPYHRIMGGCECCCGCHVLLRENLISEIAQKFWVQRQRTRYLTHNSLRQRIAMRLWDEYRKTGSLTLNLGGTREDLADFLGVNRSALSRELSRMKQEGILDYYRDTFRLLQPEKIAEYAKA